MSQPVEIFYVVPLGAVIAWYPPPNPQLPPNFALCDGEIVSDPDSPYKGLPTPHLTNRFPLGAGNGIAPNQRGGDTNYNLNGWNSGTLNTTSTQAGAQDNQQNGLIQQNGVSSSWRFGLSDDHDNWNDGNHHHALSFAVPAPGWVALVYIMRIK
jgi:hypothetical protein